MTINEKRKMEAIYRMENKHKKTSIVKFTKKEKLEDMKDNVR